MLEEIETKNLYFQVEGRPYRVHAEGPCSQGFAEPLWIEGEGGASRGCVGGWSHGPPS